MIKKLKAAEFLKNFNNQSATLLLLILLCTDLFFNTVYSIQIITGHFNNPLFSIKKDWGYPEMYQYLKWFWITIILINISRVKRSLSYLSWGILYIYFLLDDALEIHERIGFYVGVNLDFPPNFELSPENCGELVVIIIFGLFLGSIIAWAYFHGSLTFKKISQDMLLLVFMLVFFGVGLDIGHHAFHIGRQVSFIMGFIEDSGEMLLASLILWYVFLISVRDKNNNNYICDHLRNIIRRHFN